jgi:hypothetical protein
LLNEKSSRKSRVRLGPSRPHKSVMFFLNGHTICHKTVRNVGRNVGPSRIACPGRIRMGASDPTSDPD